MYINGVIANFIFFKIKIKPLRRFNKYTENRYNSMKKKSIALLLTLTLVLSACGNADTSLDTSADTVESSTIGTSVAETQEPSSTETSTAETTLSDLDALAEVEVEKDLFDVTITLPAEYVGEMTQEELDAAAAEKGYQVTLNQDGSATYIMTKSQHAEMLHAITEQINESLDAMIGSEDYPNFTDIEANNDFTSFTVTTTSTELDTMESLSVMVFYVYGGMYDVYSGNGVENIHVDFVNADSGAIISSADSSDLGE